jgi:hypothetical protein
MKSRNRSDCEFDRAELDFAAQLRCFCLYLTGRDVSEALDITED